MDRGGKEIACTHLSESTGLYSLTSESSLLARGVDVTCVGAGDVTVRFFTSSYKVNIPSGELCAGARRYTVLPVIPWCDEPDPRSGGLWGLNEDP